MGLAWFGNPDWDDDRPPTVPVAVHCTGCNSNLIWSKPVMYDGPPPKHDCGGEVVIGKTGPQAP
jgi:hypothetical protein